MRFLKEWFLEAGGLVILVVGLGLLVTFYGYYVGKEAGRAEVLEELSQSTKGHVGTIQGCNRVFMLSCMACHSYPDYTIDVVPEVWEED